MEQLLADLRLRFPELRFNAGKQFCWSPETQEVVYKLFSSIAGKPQSHASNQRFAWSLLHETGHALLEHTSYQADFKLILLEVAAWEKARELASEYDITIDEDHIQDCLDTYRDWLYRRSICPTCKSKCLQQGDFAHYRCFNCHTVWRVTPSRFCRTYRTTKNVARIPEPAIFHQIHN